MKSRVVAYAVLMTVMTINQAFAGFFQITPNPTPPPAPPSVPEFDGPGAISVIALLASAVAIFISRSKNK